MMVTLNTVTGCYWQIGTSLKQIWVFKGKQIPL
jgi:hypothetical protein